MITSLTVILGAGASVDLIPPYSRSSIKDERYQPKVTRDLFNTHPYLEKYYLSFLGVAQVLGELRSITDPENSAKSLEVYLKSLKEAPEEYKRKQFRHFAPYLQYFFDLVSREYCHSPVNYNSLLNETLKEKINKVVYVTLNYDLLFDMALKGRQYLFASKDIKKYIPRDQKWAYIKLHGSVNWGKPIRKEFIRNPGLTLGSLFDNVDQLGDDLDKHLGEIVVDFSYQHPAQRQPVYPAISVPVDGESKYNCPPEHVELLKQHLNRCQNFLVIGYSGVDNDLLCLLSEKEGGFNKVQIVSESEESARKTIDNFFKYPNLEDKLQGQIFPYKGEGFSSFIQDGSLKKFIDDTIF